MSKKIHHRKINDELPEGSYRFMSDSLLESYDKGETYDEFPKKSVLYIDTVKLFVGIRHIDANEYFKLRIIPNTVKDDGNILSFDTSSSFLSKHMRDVKNAVVMRKENLIIFNYAGRDFQVAYNYK